eukprot:1316230-Ditylum_brightwellii.AAC.2
MHAFFKNTYHGTSVHNPALVAILDNLVSHRLQAPSLPSSLAQLAALHTPSITSDHTGSFTPGNQPSSSHGTTGQGGRGHGDTGCGGQSG